MATSDSFSGSSVEPGRGLLARKLLSFGFWGKMKWFDIQGCEIEESSGSYVDGSTRSVRRGLSRKGLWTSATVTPGRISTTPSAFSAPPPSREAPDPHGPSYRSPLFHRLLVRRGQDKYLFAERREILCIIFVQSAHLLPQRLYFATLWP